MIGDGFGLFQFLFLFRLLFRFGQAPTSVTVLYTTNTTPRPLLALLGRISVLPSGLLLKRPNRNSDPDPNFRFQISETTSSLRLNP